MAPNVVSTTGIMRSPDHKYLRFVRGYMVPFPPTGLSAVTACTQVKFPSYCEIRANMRGRSPRTPFRNGYTFASGSESKL